MKSKQNSNFTSMEGDVMLSDPRISMESGELKGLDGLNGPRLFGILKSSLKASLTFSARGEGSFERTTILSGVFNSDENTGEASISPSLSVFVFIESLSFSETTFPPERERVLFTSKGSLKKLIRISWN